MDAFIDSAEGLLREAFNYPVEKIADIGHVGCTYRYRFTKSELVEIKYDLIRLRRGIDFIYYKDHFLARTAKKIRDLSVSCCETLFSVHHEADHVGHVHCHDCLISHLRTYGIIRTYFDSSGIDDSEFLAVPLCLGVDPVACNTRHVFDYRTSFTYKPVEECRLSDIRPSYYC